MALIGLVFNYLRPLPHAAASITPLDNAPQKTSLTWPSYGSAAIGAAGFGVLETHGSQQPRPMASIAKVITALAVLEKYPLAAGQAGPTLQMSQKDVDLFSHYYKIGGSYVLVENGEKISQYQALQAVLLPSANNMADSLALWAFGSMSAYHEYASAMLKRLNLTQTTISDDASGMSSKNTSTPSDLVALGELALRNEVINEIIRQPHATIPVHGVVYSANARLASTGKVFGIKTGLTDEAGACYLFAGEHTVEDRNVTIIGVISGMNTIREPIKASEPLVESSKKYFTLRTPVKAGEIFAELTTPWLTTAKVVAKQDISLVSWKGSTLQPRVELANINRSLPAGAQVGTAVVQSGSNKATAPLVLQDPINGPSWQWRIKRF